MDPAETTTPHKVKKISAANALPLSPAYDEGREPVVYKLVLTGGNTTHRIVLRLKRV